jgi:hypothetical protein
MKFDKNALKIGSLSVHLQLCKCYCMSYLIYIDWHIFKYFFEVYSQTDAILDRMKLKTDF